MKTVAMCSKKWDSAEITTSIVRAGQSPEMFATMPMEHFKDVLKQELRKGLQKELSEAIGPVAMLFRQPTFEAKLDAAIEKVLLDKIDKVFKDIITEMMHTGAKAY